MFDFIKTGKKLTDVDAFLRKLESNDVKYDGKFDGETYEVTGEYSARIKNISLQVYPSRWLIISGSIHEYWNDGKHNYNDFTLQDFIKAVDELSITVGIDLWDLRLFKIEVGVNIKPPITSKEILHNTFMHKKLEFKWASITGEGAYYHCKHKEYHIKLYDKAKQHNLPYELLRYEIYITSEMLKKHRIYKVADVLIKENIEYMVNFLQEEFVNILFYDPTINKKNMIDQQKAQLSEWSNSRFWSTLSKRSSSKNIFSNAVNSFRDLQIKHSENIQAQNLELITKKLGELDNIFGQEFTALFGRNGKDFNSEQEIFNQPKFDDQNGSFGSSIIVPFNAEVRRCKLTKLDISMQVEDSVYLTVVGVEYHHQNFPEIYKRLETMLSPKWKDAPVDKRNLEIAHNIRNKVSNRKNSLKKQLKRNKDHYSLFRDPTLLNPELSKFPEIINESGYMEIDKLKKE